MSFTPISKRKRFRRKFRNRHGRSARQPLGLTSESLEPRVLLAADLAYPTDPLNALITDITLVADDSGNTPTLTLFETGTNNQLATVPLDDAGDVTVNITRGVLPEAFGDTLRIDLNSFETLNPFVSANGGQLAITFDGGTEVPLVSDDHVRLQGGDDLSLDYGLNLTSTSDVAAEGLQTEWNGIFTIDSQDTIEISSSTIVADEISLNASDSATGEADALDPTEIVAFPTVGISVHGSRLLADNVSLAAEATVDTTIELADLLDGGISLGAIVATSSADISIDEGSRILADNALTINANSDVSTSLIRAPEDDGDAADDDQTQDASLAASVIASSSTITIGDDAMLEGGTVEISAENVVDASTTADGTVGTSDAGGIVATTVVTGETSVLVHDSASIDSTGDLSLTANSNRSVATAAIATAEGATDDGDAGTTTAGQQTLADNNAETSDGDVTLAATVAVSTLSGDTTARVDGANLTSATGQVVIGATANHDVSTISDATTTSGSGGTGVGVGVAIGRVNAESAASVAGNSTVAGRQVSVESVVSQGTSNVEAMSGPSGDAEGADVGVAGALSINTGVVNALATVDPNANVNFGGAEVVLTADSVIDSTSRALPHETPEGESIGVGASVALNIADHTTQAKIEDGAIVSAVGDLTLNAGAEQDLTTEAQGAAAGGTAIAAVVSLLIANEDTTAEIGTGGVLDVAGNLTLAANHSGSSNTQALGDAEGTDSAAIGAAIALNFVDQRTEAVVSRDVTATRAISIGAHDDSSNDVTATASAQGTEGDDGGDPDTDAQAAAQRSVGDQAAQNGGARTSSDAQSTPSASTSDGTVSVAAAVGVNVVETVARSMISGPRQITAGRPVSLTSSANTDAVTSADAQATSESSVGVGAAVAVNTVDVTNHAVVDDNSIVDAPGLTLSALMKDVDGDAIHTFSADTVSGAGDGDIGVAGSVAIELVNTDTQATLRQGTDITLAGSPLVLNSEAITSSTSTAIPEGDGGEGTDVGVGASVALNRVDNVVRAEVQDEVSFSGTARSLSMTATGDHTIMTDAQNGAAGDVGIGAAVAVVIVDNDTHARLGVGPELAVDTTADVVTSHQSEITSTVGAEAAGDSVGIGASVVVHDIQEDGSAVVARDLAAGGDVSVVSTSHVNSNIDAEASAGGSDANGNDADTEADKQRNSNPNNGGNSVLPSASDETNNASSSANSESSTESGSVNVAAVVAVNVVHANNTAAIEDGADVTTPGALEVTASAQVDSDVRAKGTAITTAQGDDNVAAAVALNRTVVDNVARVDGASTLDASGINISARTPEGEVNDHIVWAAAAAGGTGDLGGAGSVAINLVDITNEASTGAASHLLTTSDTTVAARNDLNIQTLAAGGGFSQDTAFGASVVVNSIDSTTTATLGGDADVDGALVVSARTEIVPTQMDVPLLNDAQDPFATSVAVAGGASTGDTALAAAAVINIFDLTTEASIADNANVNQQPELEPPPNQSVTVTAEDVTEIISFTGALGASFGSIGFGAGLDLGIFNKQTSATIGNQTQVDATNGVLVSATSVEDFITLSTNLGLAQDVGIAGSASVYVVETATDAEVGNQASIDAGGDVDVTSDGQFKLTSLAGALAFGSNAGIGAANVTLTHDDTVTATIGDGATVSTAGANGLHVAASSNEDLIGTSAAGGASSSAAIAGSATVLILDETTLASIGDSTTIVADNGDEAGEADVRVTAVDDTRIVSVAGSLALSGGVALGLGADVGTITKTTEANIGSGVEADVEGDVFVTADSSEDITSVGAGVGVGANVGVALDAAVHVMNLTTRAWIGDDPSDAVPSAGAGDFHASGSIVIAADDQVEVDNVVGVLGAGAVGLGAAAGVATINKTTEAFIGDGAQVTADGLTDGLDVRTGEFAVSYTAASLSTTGVEAEGDVSIDADGGTLSAQGEVGLADLEDLDIDQQGGSEATDESLTGQRTLTHVIQSDFHGISVTATNRDDIETFTISFGAGTAAVAVSAGINVISANTQAWIGANATINGDTSGAHALQSVNVAAGSDFTHFGLAGSAAAAGWGFAPAVGATILNNTTQAFIGNGATTNANNDVSVVAHGTEDILLVGVGFAVGTLAAFGGAVDVLSVDNTVTAFLGENSTTFAGGDVLVHATDHSDIDVISGAAAGGYVGGAGSVGVISLTKDTAAFIGTGASVDALGAGTGITDVLNGDMVGDGDSFETTTAHGLVVQADTSEDILHIAAAAGAGFVGVAGGVAVTLIDSDTSAFIDENADINQLNNNAGAENGQSVFVVAGNDVRAFSFAGSLAAGAGAVSGAVDVGRLKNDTSAEVRDGVQMAADENVEINALGIKDLQGYTFSFAPGLVALSGAVSVWSVGTPLEKDYSNDQGESANALVGDEAESSEAADENAAGQANDAVAQPALMLDTYEDDAGNPNNSSQKQVGSITGMAASQLSASSMSQADILDAINSGDTAAGTTAQIAAGATVDAGADVQVSANEDLDMNVTIGGFSGAIGGSVGIFSTAANASAHADGTLTAGTGDVLVTATLDQDVDVLSLSGQVGFVGLGAAVIVLNDLSTVHATVGSVTNAVSVEVLADADQIMTLTTGQLQGGALAVGASFSRLSADGDVIAGVTNNAQIGQQPGESVDTLNVVANSRLLAEESTTALAAAGGVAISANFAVVDVTPRVEASVGQSADIEVSGDVVVQSTAEFDVDAEVLTAAGAGTVAVGASIAESTLDADVLALVGVGATVSAGNGIVIESRKNHDGVDALPNRGTRARADAPSAAGGVSGSGTIATATDSTLVRSRVAPDAQLTSGNGADDDIAISASSSADAVARGLALSLGLVGSFGATVVTATTDGETEAILNGSAAGGGDLRVESNAIHLADADADAASAAGFSGNVFANSLAEVTPQLQASLGNGLDAGTVDMGQNVIVHASSLGDADADTFGLSAGAGALGVMTAAAQMTPEIHAFVENGMSVTAGESIELRSLHNENGQGETQAAADAPAAGIVAGSGTVVTADARANLDTFVAAGASIDAGADISLESTSTNLATATGEALTVGLVTLGLVTTDAVASGTTRARMDGDILAGTTVSIAAEATEEAAAFSEAASAGGWGSGAASQATAVVGDNASPVDEIQASIGSGASIAVSDEVTVQAVSIGSADGEAQGVSVAGAAAFGVGRGESLIDSQVRGFVGDNVTLEASDLTVQARHNTNDDLVPVGNESIATSWSAAGALGAALNVISAPATASADAEAYVGENGQVNVAGGAISILAQSSNRARSVPNNISVGGLGSFGVTDSHSTVDGSARAHLDSTVSGPGETQGADTISIVAQTEAIAPAEATTAAGAGLFGGQSTLATSVVEPTVEAFMNGDQDIRTDSDITIQANALTDALAEAHGVTVAGGFSAGGSTATAELTPHVHAFVGENSEVNVRTGEIIIAATHNQGTTENGAHANATASSGGAVAGSGAFADATIELDVDAYVLGNVSNRGDVLITANSDNLAEAEAGGLAGGLVGIGNTQTSAVIGGTQQSYLGDGVVFEVTDLELNNEADSVATANTQAVSLGLGVAVSGNSANASIDQTVNTTIGDFGEIDSGGLLLLRGVSLADASAIADGTAVGGASFGGSIATATVDPTVLSEIGNSTVEGSLGIHVLGLHNATESGPTGARANAEAHSSSGGALVGVGGAAATAVSTADVTASVGNGLTSFETSSGSLDVIAANNNDARALADGVGFGGALGIGVSQAVATANGQTNASIQPSAVVRGGGVNVNAATIDVAIADSEAAALGLLAAGDGAIATTNVVPSISAEIGNGADIDVTGSVEVAIESATEGDAVAAGISLAGGASGGVSTSHATVSPDISAAVGNNVTILSGESIAVTVTHNDTVTPYNGSFNGNAHVDTANNVIDLPGAHGLSTGDRVTYVDGGNLTIGGLVDGQSYAVIVEDDNTVQLGQVFDANQEVDSVTDEITFELPHGLANGQRVFYGNNGNANVNGLSSGSAYFVHVVDEFTIKLYTSQAAAIAADETFMIGDVDGPANTIDLAGNPFSDGEAVTYVAPESERFAGAAVNAPGEAANSITFQAFAFGGDDGGGGGGGGAGHGFAMGEHVTYRADGAKTVGGLVDGNDYYVVVVNADTLQLASDAELMNIVTLTSPDDPDDPEDEPSLHFLSRFEEVPLTPLEDGRTYYVHIPDPMEPNIIQLRATPGGSALNLVTANTVGLHGLRGAGIELNAAGTSGLHTLAVDLTAVGNGTQRLIGAGGALGVSSASVNGVSSANARGTGGALLGSARLSQSTVDLTSDVSAIVGSSSTLEAAEDVRVESDSALNAAGVARAFTGAIVGIGTSRAKINMTHDVTADVGNGTDISAGRDIVVHALSNHDATGNTRAVGGGGINVATSEANVDILHETTIDIQDSASLLAGRDVDMFARAEFGGNITAEASSGGFAIRPDSLARYAVGDSNEVLEDTTIHVGNGTEISADRDASLVAQVDNDGRIDVRAESRAFGVLADTNADANSAVRSRTLVQVDGGATLTGRDSLLVMAEHLPLSVFNGAIANGKAASDSDAWVRFSPVTESHVIGEDDATFISHDLQVHANVHENSFGYSWSLFGAWPVSDGGSEFNWRSVREVVFDSDVILLSADVELVVDSSGQVTTADGVTVNGGNGEGYIIPGDGFTVDTIENNDPGHALFATNELADDMGDLFPNRGGVVRRSTGDTLGTFFVRHTIDFIDILNQSNKNMTIGDVFPVDRDGNPPATVDIESREITLEFDIAHRFDPTQIDINTESNGISSTFLGGVIDNPIGTTSIVTNAGAINVAQGTPLNGQLIRSNIVDLNADHSVNRIEIDLVESIGRPEDLRIVAGEDIRVGLRGVRRWNSAGAFNVNVSEISAGDAVTLTLKKSIEELVLDGVGDYDLIVDTDLYTENPAPESFERYYTPDTLGGAILQGGVLGVFGGFASTIPSTYVFDLVQAQDVNIGTTADNDCTSIDANIVILDGPGGLDVLGPNDITINTSSRGDLPLGTIRSDTGDVTVIAAGNIINGTRQTTPNIVGNNVRLTSQRGAVGDASNPILVDSGTSRTGELSVDTEGDIFITETAGSLRQGTIVSRLGTVSITAPEGLVGDFDGDGMFTTADVNALIRQMSRLQPDLTYDLTGDRRVDFEDLSDWVVNIKKTFLGDANLDGSVNATDLNRVGLSWQSRDGGGWFNGDFNGDGNVNATDLNILALNWQDQRKAATVGSSPRRAPKAPLAAVAQSQPQATADAVFAHAATNSTDNREVDLRSDVAPNGQADPHRDGVVEQTRQVSSLKGRRSLDASHSTNSNVASGDFDKVDEFFARHDARLS